MTVRTVQLYPSEQNYQLTNDDSVPWRQAAAMLAGIVAKLPADDQASVRISGWKSLRLTVDHTLTPQEVAAEKHDALVAALRAATRDGLTADAVKALLLKV